MFELGTGVSCIAFVEDGLLREGGRCFSGYEASLLGAQIPFLISLDAPQNYNFIVLIMVLITLTVVEKFSIRIE